MLSHSGVIQRFLDRRKGKGSSLESDGVSLKDYGWYRMAWWDGDLLVVHRYPFGSLTSKGHHKMLIWALKERGLKPAAWKEFDREVVWTEDGDLWEEVEEKDLGEGIVAKLTIYTPDATVDSVSFSTPIGEVESWRSNERAVELFRMQRWKELRALAVRLVASQKAYSSVSGKLSQVKEKAHRLAERLARAGDTGPFRVYWASGGGVTYWQVSWEIGQREAFIDSWGAGYLRPKIETPSVQLKVYRDFLRLWEGLPEKQRVAILLEG